MNIFQVHAAIMMRLFVNGLEINHLILHGSSVCVYLTMLCLWCRPALDPLVHPLCTLVSLTSLRSITITKEREGFSQLEIEALAQLKTISSLTLRSAHGKQPCLDICRLSQLTNLQQLRVAGLGLVPVVDEQPSRALPSSLSSLVLGGGQVVPVKAWLDHLSAPGSLQCLRLVNAAAGGVQEAGSQVNWGVLSSLRELHISLPAVDTTGMQTIRLPGSMSVLTALEVLMVDTHQQQWPWSQYRVFAMCTLRKLRQIGRMVVIEPCIVAPEAGGALAAAPPCTSLPHLTRLESLQYGKRIVRHWGRVSQLQHLSLELLVLDRSGVQQLQGLTQLTCLKLSSGLPVVQQMLQNETLPRPIPEWDSLEPVGRALVKLHRLELVNCCKGQEGHEYPTLIVPEGLSSFTQVKELQLICAVPPTKPLPQQPSQQQLLQGISALTQLQQLELSGYSTVTPMLVVSLAGCITQLQGIKVGLCNHPDVEEARQQHQQQGAGGGAGVQPGLGHSSWGEMKELLGCSHPKLSVEVEVAQQWRT